jgi:hypothetical protein
MAAPNDKDRNDQLGHPLRAEERELLELYRRLRELSARTDLEPCALMNCKQAMVMLWNACNDLGLVGEEPGVD